MVMIFFHKQIIIFLNKQTLASSQLRRFDLLQDFIIDLRALVDQFQFGLIAMAHSSIEFSLQEEGDYEPINGDQTV